jgi:23S rRNA (uracil1939-C5)-methyltransferase
VSKTASHRTPSLRRVEIERLSLGGEGVARADGKVFFVPHTAPGDVVDVEPTDIHARYARARLVEVIKTSSERITPPCPYHFRPTPSEKREPLFCGGCSWQHLTYDSQLEAKRQILKETLERLGGLKGVEVKAVLGMKDPWRYRNKVQEPVGWNGEQLVAGFYAQESHVIVPIKDCLVQTSLSVALINRARELLEQHHIRAYDGERHQGWIRHLWVRTAGDQALLVFVTRTPDFPSKDKILEPLVKEFPPLAGIHQNVNPGRTNVILGREWIKQWGADHIEERLGSLRFRLSPGSFFQVNSHQAKVLYDVATSMAGRGERLLDLYCGVGGLALSMAQRFNEVGGVDEVPSAIQNAENNAELNGIENARFIAEPVESFLRNLRRPPGLLCISVDPPRAGCAPQVIERLVQLEPDRIVYVSCDPGTLARDLALLVQGGYRVQEVQPVDLFPHTPHIETVVRLDYQGS